MVSRPRNQSRHAKFLKRKGSSRIFVVAATIEVWLSRVAQAALAPDCRNRPIVDYDDPLPLGSHPAKRSVIIHAANMPGFGA
jgi:hypothetical protein